MWCVACVFSITYFTSLRFFRSEAKLWCVWCVAKKCDAGGACAWSERSTLLSLTCLIEHYTMASSFCLACGQTFREHGWLLHHLRHNPTCYDRVVESKELVQNEGLQIASHAGTEET